MNVFQIDARIEELKAEVKLLQKKRNQAQANCHHEYGAREWSPPGCYEDSPEGDWYKQCLKCKKIRFVRQKP